MRIEAKVEDRTFVFEAGPRGEGQGITLDQEGAGAFEAEVTPRGDRVEVSLRDESPSLHLDLPDSTLERLRAGEEVTVRVLGKEVALRVSGSAKAGRPKPAKRGKAGAGTRAGVPGGVYPPMPGTVIEVTVSEGDQVSEGDVVLVLEAMKMQSDIHAPSDGVVGEILVQEGQKVAKDTLLMVMTPRE